MAAPAAPPGVVPALVPALGPCAPLEPALAPPVASFESDVEFELHASTPSTAVVEEAVSQRERMSRASLIAERGAMLDARRFASLRAERRKERHSASRHESSGGKGSMTLKPVVFESPAQVI